MFQRILLLDLNYHLRRSLHVKALSELRDSSGRKTGGVLGLLNSIQKILSLCAPCEKVIGVWDGGHSKRRLSLYPPDEKSMVGYKVSRGLHPGLTEEEKAERAEIRQTVITSAELATPLMQSSGVHVIQWPEREADDVIALLAKSLAGQYAKQVVIASDDWDFAQCVSEHVCVRRQVTNEWISLHNFMPRIGVPVDWFVLRKAVLGKNSDDIHGVKGVGQVYVAKAVKAFVSETLKGYREDWYEAHQYRDACPADLTPFFDFCGKDSRKKFQDISNCRKAVEKNIELVDFDREIFPDDHTQTVLQGVLSALKFDEMSAVHQLGSLGVNSLLENFSHWSEPFRRIS